MTLIAAAVIVPLELIVGWLIPFFFGDDFSGAVVVTRILLIGVFFVSIRRVLTDGARGAGFPGLGVDRRGGIMDLARAAARNPASAILGSNGVAVAMSISAAFSLAVLAASLLRLRNFRRPVTRRESRSHRSHIEPLSDRPGRPQSPPCDAFLPISRPGARAYRSS